MAVTNKLISSYTVGSGGVSTVTFSSIPQFYTDLKLVASVRTDSNSINDGVILTINDSSNAIYNYVRIVGNGSTITNAIVTGNTNLYVNFAANANVSTSNTFGNTEIYFLNYTSSSNKSINADAVVENNATTSYISTQAHLFEDTSPITKISYTPGTTILQYSSFYLYGIKNS